MRDSQRQKVYDAERCVQRNATKADAMTIAECQAMVDKILASTYVRRHYERAEKIVTRYGTVKVVPGRNGGMARGFDVYYDGGRHVGGPVIALGIWARQEFVVIHEVAHHLAGLHERHGWRFVACELDLVRHFLGADVHDRLKASFRKHRVRFTAPRPKRVLTDEQRAAALRNLTATRKPGTSKPTFRPDDLDVLTFTCKACGCRLRFQKFPTTRTPGVREAVCRDCRDDHREWT